MKYPKLQEHKEFQSETMSLGCIITGDKHNIQLHHVVGRSYVQNKVHVGHYFVNPLHFSLHDISSNSMLNVTYYRKNFTQRYGLQKDLYLNRVVQYELSVPEEVLEAISTINI